MKISARTSYPSLLQVINNGGKVIRTSNLIIFGRLHGCVENLGLEYFADTFKENPSAIEFLKKTFPLTDNIEMNIGGTANYVVKPFHMMTPLVQMRSALSVVEGQMAIPIHQVKQCFGITNGAQPFLQQLLMANVI